MRYPALARHIAIRRAELIVLMLVMALLLLSVMIRPAPEAASLVARSGSVRAELIEPFLSEGSFALRTGGLVAGRVSNVFINDGPATPDALLTALRLGKGAVTLNKIALGKGAKFRLSRGDADCLALALSAGLGEIEASVDDQALKFGVKGALDGSSDLTLCPTDRLRLAVFGVRSFDFDERFEANASQHYSMSTLASADLSFPDLGIKRDISALAGLRLTEIDPAEPVVIDVEKGAELTVSYAGRVGSAMSGSETHPRSLLPLLLEHFLGTSPIAFAITGFGFFWGLLWSVIRFARPPQPAR